MQQNINRGDTEKTEGQTCPCGSLVLQGHPNDFVYGVREEYGVCWGNNIIYKTIYGYGKKENISVLGSHE